MAAYEGYSAVTDTLRVTHAASYWPSGQLNAALVRGPIDPFE